MINVKRPQDIKKNRAIKKKIAQGLLAEKVQNYLPIKDIRNGIIITNDDRYVKIIECSSINFLLRSYFEQECIVQSFASLLKIAPDRIHFKAFSKRTDTNEYLEILKKEMAEETNVNCKVMQLDHMNLICQVGSQQGVTRRFYIIFEYDSVEKTRSTADINVISSTLSNIAIQFKNYMQQCGNEITIYDDVDKTNSFLLEVLYEIINRKKAESVPFRNHLNEIKERYRQFNREVNGIDDYPFIPVNQMICPEYIDLTNKNYIVIDGLYYCFLYITSNGYNPIVGSGWMSPIVNAGEGIDVDIFFEKLPRETVQNRIGQHIRMNKAKIADMGDTNANYDAVGSAIQAGYYFKQGLANNEDVYYVSTLITIVATNPEALQYRVKEFQKMLRSKDMIAKPCKYEQEAAFLSTLPLCKLSKSIYNKSKRNMLTSSAASTYLFTSFELCDKNGILLGINEYNESLVIVDIFNSKQYKNANIAILGTSGAGKTFLLQLMALRMRMKNIQVFIIAPDKGEEFIRACKNIGGQYVKIAAGSDNCINIMEIRKPNNENIKKLYGDITGSLLAKKIQQLHIFFGLVFKDITEEEKNILDEAIIDTYKAKGITTDNASLIDPEHPDRYKEMPVLGDLYKQLVNNRKAEKLANILKRYVEGSLNTFNGQTNVDLDNKFVVLDVSEMTDDRNIGMFIALDYVWDKAKEDKTKKKAIFLDELWQLIGAKSNVLAAEFVLEIFKIIRGYGGSAIAATQDINDFFALEDGKYGKGIINNAKTKIILNLEPNETERVQEILNLTDAESSKLIKFERGEALISTNQNNVLVKITPSQKEYEIITTDREDLSKLANRG